MNKRKITYNHYSGIAIIKITKGMINKLFTFKTLDEYMINLEHYYTFYSNWYCKYKKCILADRNYKWVKKL